MTKMQSWLCEIMSVVLNWISVDWIGCFLGGGYWWRLRGRNSVLVPHELGFRACEDRGWVASLSLMDFSLLTKWLSCVQGVSMDFIRMWFKFDIDDTWIFGTSFFNINFSQMMLIFENFVSVKVKCNWNNHVILNQNGLA